MEQLAIFEERLPYKPYCTDELSSGLIIRSRSSALRRRYIQANPPNIQIWMTFDVDREQAGFAWEDANLPMPNWSAINPINSHAHLTYGLEAPVATSNMARQAPLRYLAAIQGAYRATLKADNSYSGLITKNPKHPSWKTLWGSTQLYSLSELAEYVDLNKHQLRRDLKPENYGLGRNCTVFDRARVWSYKAIKKYWDGSQKDWYEAVEARVLIYNAEFPKPLEFSECVHIAKSISKWTWQYITKREFSRIQAQRGKRTGEKKRKAYMAAVIRMHEDGKSNREIARELDIDDKTVAAWLKRADTEKPYNLVSQPFGSSTDTSAIITEMREQGICDYLIKRELGLFSSTFRRLS